MSTHFGMISRITEAYTLDTALRCKAQSPALERLRTPEGALRFLRTNLCGSYLFSRYVVPSYGAAIFSELRNHPPLDDAMGRLVRTLMRGIEGEICNNNIHERPDECHSHYHDLRAAYAAAGQDLDEVKRFEIEMQYVGLRVAIDRSPLWTEGSRRYGGKLLALCDDPLAVTLLMASTEFVTPSIYERALTLLPDTPELQPFRHFLARHVRLDQDDHGPATFEWAAFAFQAESATRDRVFKAFNKVLRLYGVHT